MSDFPIVQTFHSVPLFWNPRPIPVVKKSSSHPIPLQKKFVPASECFSLFCTTNSSNVCNKEERFLSGSAVLNQFLCAERKVLLLPKNLVSSNPENMDKQLKLFQVNVKTFSLSRMFQPIIFISPQVCDLVGTWNSQTTRKLGEGWIKAQDTVTLQC